MVNDVRSDAIISL